MIDKHGIRIHCSRILISNHTNIKVDATNKIGWFLKVLHCNIKSMKIGCYSEAGVAKGRHANLKIVNMFVV